MLLCVQPIEELLSGAHSLVCKDLMNKFCDPTPEHKCQFKEKVFLINKSM